MKTLRQSRLSIEFVSIPSEIRLQFILYESLEHNLGYSVPLGQFPAVCQAL